MNLHLFSSALVVIALGQAQTVDEIVARNIAARGGVKRLRNLGSQTMIGTLAFAPNPGEPFRAEMKRTGKIRQEISVNRDQFTQVSDGAAGWTLRADKPAEPMSAGLVHDLGGSADMQGPLFNYRQKGNKVALAGTDTIEGHPVYKLIITMKDGTQRTDFIDAKTYLELKWEGVVGGQKMETFFHDYRKVKGVSYSFSMDSSGPGFQQKLVFLKIEVNPKLPDSRFTRP